MITFSVTFTYLMLVFWCWLAVRWLWPSREQTGMSLAERLAFRFQQRAIRASCLAKAVEAFFKAYECAKRAYTVPDELRITLKDQSKLRVFLETGYISVVEEKTH